MQNRYKKLLGYIISRHQSKDHDLVYRVFTQTRGTITALGKGTRSIVSTRANKLDTLNLVELDTYSRGDIYYINDVKLVEDYPNIKTNLDLLTIVSRLFYLIKNTIPEGQADQNIFDYIRLTMDNTDKEQKKRYVVSSMIELLDDSGFVKDTDIDMLRDNYKDVVEGKYKYTSLSADIEDVIEKYLDL